MSRVKANDVQIGDFFVADKRVVRVVGKNDITVIVKIKQADGEFVYLEKTIPELEPIPLNKKNLLANGFEKVDYCWRYVNHNTGLTVSIYKDGAGATWVLGRGEERICVEGRKFVHEMQHLWRMLGCKGFGVRRQTLLNYEYEEIVSKARPAISYGE